MKKHNLDIDQLEKGTRHLLHAWLLLLCAAIILMAFLIKTETAQASVKKPATCKVLGEDKVWVYDTYDLGTGSAAAHHIATFKPGRKMKVYATKNGMAKIKLHGRTAWIGTRMLDVTKKGWIKLEGKWKLVKPGFDFLAYIKWGEEYA